MGLSGIITFLITLLIIIGVVVFTYFTTKWMGSKMGMQNNSTNLKVLEKMFITPDKCIIIADIAGKIMVLAMSSHAIEKIDEIQDVGALNLEQTKSTIFSDLLEGKLAASVFGGKKNPEGERGADEGNQ